MNLLPAADLSRVFGDAFVLTLRQHTNEYQFAVLPRLYPFAHRISVGAGCAAASVLASRRRLFAFRSSLSRLEFCRPTSGDLTWIDGTAANQQPAHAFGTGR